MVIEFIGNSDLVKISFYIVFLLIKFANLMNECVCVCVCVCVWLNGYSYYGFSNSIGLPTPLFLALTFIHFTAPIINMWWPNLV